MVPVLSIISPVYSSLFYPPTPPNANNKSITHIPVFVATLPNNKSITNVPMFVLATPPNNKSIRNVQNVSVAHKLMCLWFI